MNGSPEGKDCANLLGYPRHAEHTGRLHRHRVKVKMSTLPAKFVLIDFMLDFEDFGGHSSV